MVEPQQSTFRNPRDDQWTVLRRDMVEDQLRARGIQDEGVLDSMMNVPRERFVPAHLKGRAYADKALAVDHGQTISQPYIVALMTDRLELTATDRVLEIGTGTGYQTAILARLCGHVHTVERIAALSDRAAEVLSDLGVANVSFITGDGSVGLPEQAPFDGIIVTAGAPRLPKSLTAQLVDGGRLIAPIGTGEHQTLIRAVRRGRRVVEKALISCRFVKLIGCEGWPDSPKQKGAKNPPTSA